MKILRAGNWLTIESASHEGRNATAIGLHMAAMEELDLAIDARKAAEKFERAGRDTWARESRLASYQHKASADHWTRLAKRYERPGGVYERRLADPGKTSAGKGSAAVFVKQGIAIGYASVTYKPGDPHTEFELGPDLVESGQAA